MQNMQDMQNMQQKCETKYSKEQTEYVKIM